MSLNSKKAGFFFVFILLCHILSADFKCELYGELKEKRVKLYFRCVGWDKTFNGFIVKKKDEKSGLWVSLTSIPLRPSIEADKNWALYGDENFKKKAKKLIKKYKLPLLSKIKYHELLTKHGGLKSGDRLGQIDNFDYSLLMGFGFIINQLNDTKPVFRLYALIGENEKLMSEISFAATEQIDLRENVFNFYFSKSDSITFQMNKKWHDIAAIKGFDIYGVGDGKRKKLNELDVVKAHYQKDLRSFSFENNSNFDKVKIVPVNIFGSELAGLEIKAGQIINKKVKVKQEPKINLISAQVKMITGKNYIVVDYELENIKTVGLAKLKFYHPETKKEFYSRAIFNFPRKQFKLKLPSKLYFKKMDRCTVRLFIRAVSIKNTESLPVELKLPFEIILTKNYIQDLKVNVVFENNKRSLNIKWKTKLKKYDKKNYFRIKKRKKGEKHYFNVANVLTNSFNLKLKDYEFGDLDIGVELQKDYEWQKPVVLKEVFLWKLDLPWPLIKKPIKNKNHILLTWENREDKHVKGYRIKRRLKDNRFKIVSGEKLIPWNISKYKVTDFSKKEANHFVVEAINHFDTVGGKANAKVVYNAYDIEKWRKKAGDEPINFKAKLRKGQKGDQLVDLSWDVDKKYKDLYSGFVVYKGIKRNSVYRVGTSSLRDNFLTYKVPEKLLGKEIIFRVRMVYHRTKKQMKDDENSSKGEYAELKVDLSK